MIDKQSGKKFWSRQIFLGQQRRSEKIEGMTERTCYSYYRLFVQDFRPSINCF